MYVCFVYLGINKSNKDVKEDSIYTKLLFLLLSYYVSAILAMRCSIAGI